MKLVLIKKIILSAAVASIVLTPSGTHAILPIDQQAVNRDSTWFVEYDQDLKDCLKNGLNTGKPVVALDPGHGADIAPYVDTVSLLKDRETNNMPEGDDVLDVSNRVKTQLEAAGYTVVLLRTASGQAINKRARVDAAVAAKANLTISIHTGPGELNQVWPQRMGTYREFEGTRVTFGNQATATASQNYANAIAAARQTAEGHTISQDPDQSAQTGSFSRDDIPSKGNISLVQLWGEAIPWVYNEIGQNDGTAINEDLKAKYATGIVEGVKASLPAAAGAAAVAAATACCPPGGVGSITLTGNTNIEKVMKFLMDPTSGPGFTVAGAAGVLGNFAVEAGPNVKPNIQQDGRAWPLGGWGIAQWTAGRRHDPGKLVDRIKAAGLERLYTDNRSFDLDLSPADNDALLGLELKFMMDELNSGYPTAMTMGKTATDPSQAAREWESIYEGCTPTWSEVQCGVDKRRAKAIEIYNAYSDAPPIAGPPGTAGTPAANPGLCTGGPGAGGNFNEKLLSYAWPDYRGDPYDITTDGYKAAWAAAPAGSYSGGAGQSSGDLGVDCGAFVTRLTIDSGFDPTYNNSGMGGPTEYQFTWLEEHWTDLTDQAAAAGSSVKVEDLRPGDVAITQGRGHTFIFVGDAVGGNFAANLASASVYTRAPMADTQQNALDSDFHWYRKK